MKRYHLPLSTLLVFLVTLLVGGLLPLTNVLGQGDQPPLAPPAVSAVSSDAASPDAASPNAATAALGTSFTYQGNLQKNGQPITATCSFQFNLWDALTGGAQKGSTQNVNNAQAQGGSFTVQSDFGNEFTGDARWLQTAVRCQVTAVSQRLARVSRRTLCLCSQLAARGGDWRCAS